jgi:hypothetical protein
MFSTERPSTLLGSRGAFRRVTGAVLIALFAHQSIAVAPMKCAARGAEPESAAMAEMGHAQHGVVSANAKRPSGAIDGPTSPAPSHPSDCDHTLPTNDCGIGVGCVAAVAVASPTILVSAPPLGAAADFFTATDGILRVEFAPDTPPPRA